MIIALRKGGSPKGDTLAHLQTCVRCQSELATLTGGAETVDGIVPQRVSPAASMPTEIGPYRVLEKLGEGGMGSVFTAYHSRLDRKVAIKVLSPQQGPGGATTDGEARLMREAQAMAQLDHPHVVAIHDVGTFENQIYLVMDRVDGVTLSQWLSEKKRGWKEIADVLAQAGRGLGAAHAAGIVHRDFKPANVLVGRDGRVRVADFGIARKSGDNTPDGSGTSATAEPDSGQVVLTRAGSVVGTPGFMAPEQFSELPADARSDQFSFCVSLYEALYRQKPYPPAWGENVLSTSRFTRKPSPPSGTDEPGFIRAAVLRGLETDPRLRFDSMGDLVAQLTRQPLTWRLAAPWVALLLVAGGSIAALAWVKQPSAIKGCTPGETNLVGTWDATTRQALLDGFAATGLSEAKAVSQNVIQALADYASTWTTQHGELCRAALGAPLDSPLHSQLKCLDLQRMQFQAVLEVLTHPNSEILGRAVLAPMSLMPPSRCRDPRAIASLPRTPDEAVLREQVQTLRFQIANGLALNTAGQPGRALAMLTPVAARAAAIGYKPFEAEIHHALGETNSLLNDSKAAVAQFRAAARAAELTGQDALAANAEASAALFVAYDGERAIAELMVEHAEVLLERSGGDAFIQSQIENSRSLLDGLALRLEKSVQHMRRAVELRREVFGPAHPRTLSYVGNLGQVLMDHCQPEAAARELSVFDAPEAARKSPVVYAKGLARLATAQIAAGQLTEASAVLDVSKSLIHDDEPDGQFDLGFSRSLLKLAEGDGASALKASQQAVEAARVIGPDSVYMVLAKEGLAAALTSVGRPAEAIDLLVDALPLHQTKLGDDQLGAYYTMLAEANLGARRFSEAMRAARLAVSQRSKGCSTAQETADLQWIMARALQAQPDARPLAVSAREAFRSMPWRRATVAEIDSFLSHPPLGPQRQRPAGDP